MSVNRPEIMPLLLCATPRALASADRALTVIVDIGDDGMAASGDVQGILRSRTSAGDGRMTFLRIRMPDDGGHADALGRLLALGPDGVVLSGCGSLADIQKLDVVLRVAEAEGGLPAESIAILAEVGGRPEFFLASHALRDASARLRGLVLNGAALRQATASEGIAMPSSRAGAPSLFARAATVIKARQADLDCYDLLTDEPLSSEALKALRDMALADGFSGVIGRSAVQLAALAEG